MAFILNKDITLRQLTAPSRQLDALVMSNGRRTVEAKKRQLLGDLNSHPISAALESGAESDASDSTEILNGVRGNLRSFIGFTPSDDPVGKLWDIFNNNIRLFEGSPTRRRINKTTIRYRLNVLIPTLKDIYAQTPYPSPNMSGSWVKGIEYGIPGLRRYLFFTGGRLTKYSRSGYAIQSPRPIRKGGPQKAAARGYVSELLRNFQASLNQ